MHRILPWLGALLLLFPALPAAAATLHFFYADNCPHCKEEIPFLETLAARHPELEIRRYDVWNQREHFDTMVAVAEAHGVEAVTTPLTALGGRAWFGFDEGIAREIEATLAACLRAGCPDGLLPVPSATPPLPGGIAPIETPLGEFDPTAHSLPALTVLLGLLDSFNPCAFFVLLFLLSLMVHVHSRGRMFLVGGTFIFFSGLIYFLFMAAWLNLFLVAGHLPALTTAAGLIALGIAALNIKDHFWLHRGPSLSLSEAAKPRLFRRMRTLAQGEHLGAVLLGTAVLAIAANTYELFCTAGFPMVYTRILTLHALSPLEYYGYLALYNVIYVIPLLVIVSLFSLTLGAHKLTETEGRLLKLLSGMMMLVLGLTLVFRPGWLQNLWAAVGLLGAALAGTLLIVLAEWLWKRARRR